MATIVNPGQGCRSGSCHLRMSDGFSGAATDIAGFENLFVKQDLKTQMGLLLIYQAPCCTTTFLPEHPSIHLYLFTYLCIYLSLISIANHLNQIGNGVL